MNTPDPLDLAELERRFNDARNDSGYARMCSLGVEIIPTLISSLRSAREREAAMVEDFEEALQLGEGYSSLKDLVAGHFEIIQRLERANEAISLTEAAEDFNANCPDCDGEGVPEACETCVPLFDRARLARREALSPTPSAEPTDADI